MKRIILVYHDLGENDKFLQVSLNDFHKHINYLLSKKYNFCDIDEILNAKKGKNIAIMFDDALINIKDAIKIMEEKKLKYNIAVITNNLDNKKYLREEELLKLNYASLYFHTFNHLDLTKLDENKLIEELTIKKNYLNSKYIVYPMGKYNENVIDNCKKQGFDYGLTVLPFHIPKKFNKYKIPRICINGYLDFNKFKFFMYKIGNFYLHAAFLKRKILRQDYLGK